MDENPSLLKQDGRGRVRTPAARREALLDEFERGGVSGAKFAALVGVKYSTFAAWVCLRRKGRAGTGASRSSPLRLVEALVACESRVPHQASGLQASALHLHLPGGVRLEIGGPEQLPLAVLLLKALGLPRPC